MSPLWFYLSIPQLQNVGTHFQFSCHKRSLREVCCLQTKAAQSCGLWPKPTTARKLGVTADMPSLACTTQTSACYSKTSASTFWISWAGRVCKNAASPSASFFSQLLLARPAICQVSAQPTFYSGVWEPQHNLTMQVLTQPLILTAQMVLLCLV